MCVACVHVVVWLCCTAIGGLSCRGHCPRRPWLPTWRPPSIATMRHRHGEGAMWENWNGGGSRNHIMLGGFHGPYFYGNLAGVTNAGLAFDRVLIAPTPSVNLTAVSATVGTARGNVVVQWTVRPSLCALGRESDDKSILPAVIDCGAARGGVIDRIEFAAYGTQNGTCPVRTHLNSALHYGWWAEPRYRKVYAGERCHS